MQQKINKQPLPEPIVVFKPTGNYSYTPNIPALGLLEPYYASLEKNELLSSLDLSLQYLHKHQTLFDGFSKNLRENFGLPSEDAAIRLKRQFWLFSFLLDRIDDDAIARYMFYNTFLSIISNTYHSHDLFCKDTGGTWKLLPAFASLRSAYWDAIIENYPKFPVASCEALMNYLREAEYLASNVISFDAAYIQKIITAHMNSESFADCFYVHQYEKLIKKRKIKLLWLPDIQKTFTSYAYRVNEILSWGDDERYKMNIKYRDFQKVNSYKKRRIWKELPVQSLGEFKRIYKAVSEILEFPFREQYNIVPLVEFLLINIFESNPALGVKAIQLYLTDGNKALLRPWHLFGAIRQKGGDWYKKLYNLFNSISFPFKGMWMGAYLEQLPEEDVNKVTLQRLYDFYHTTDSPIYFNPNLIDKFLPEEPHLYKNVLELLVGKRDADHNFAYTVPYDFFKDYPYVVEQYPKITRKVYFHQIEVQRSYDCDCDEFMVFYKNDSNFLFAYIDYLNAKHQPIYTSHFKSLTKIWKHDAVEGVIYQALMKLNQLQKYQIGDHVGTVFFVDLDHLYYKRAFGLLKRIISDHPSNSRIINMIFDICRNCLRDYYYELIKYYLVLNSDVDLFKHLDLYNNHFSGNGQAIWSDFKAEELRKIYNAIKELPDPVKYWPHLDYLTQMIGVEEKQSERERKLRFMGFR